MEPEEFETEEVVENTEKILPLSINPTQPKVSYFSILFPQYSFIIIQTTISFAPPNNAKKQATKNPFGMIIKKKSTTTDAVPKPTGGLSSLVACYDDDDEDSS